MIEQHRIVKYLLKQGAQRQDAEDAAQDTLLYFISRGQSDPDVPLVLRAAYHRWISILRSRKHEVVSDSLEYFADEKKGSDPDPRVEKLRECLPCLPDGLRQAIHDRFWLEKPHEATAREHGVTTQHQKNKIYRAKAKLRELMCC